MGKTSLAVRAAYDAAVAHAFDKIVFVSLKPRELEDDGLRDVSGFLITGLAELLNELARELRHADIAKAPEDRRPRLLLETLRDTRTLLVLDNLESLTKLERDVVFTFVKKLPPGCKAILTSRVRIGSAAEELILQKLSEDAALATLAKLADSNPALAKTTQGERLLLYKQTAGKPLLLRWTAGQIGRGSCLTIGDAIAYLKSCPKGNDPLEFIFGDLVEDFSQGETPVLCALTYFTLPAKVEHIVELAQSSKDDTREALRRLVNRSLVVPSEELQTFTLVPLVADFLRSKKPDVIAETGNRLEERVYALVVENGFEQYDRFAVLETAWPMLFAALRLFAVGPNDRLQTVCGALRYFLEFTGRFDESLALSRDAENRAISAKDWLHAGWSAQNSGYFHYLREQSTEVLASANRADAHWREARAGAREQAVAISLRGHGHRLARDYAAAITAYREAVELFRTLNRESRDVSIALNDLGSAEHLVGELDAAERDFSEALRIDKIIGSAQGIAVRTGNLASLAFDRKDWSKAESLAREALVLAEGVGRLDLIATNERRIADLLLRRDKKSEALRHAQRAVEILARLGLPSLLARARKTLATCESQKPKVRRPNPSDS
jgi:tetratricopeptide (TPR) repeat protein